jgi:nucleoid-associated protein EbfC
MKNPMQQIMKQAQAMQQKMLEAQGDLEKTETIGAAGGGMVKVTVNGKLHVRRVELDASLLNKDDKEMLEDLIVAACRDAQEKAEAASSAAMSSLTAGMPLPPGFKF